MKHYTNEEAKLRAIGTEAAGVVHGETIAFASALATLREQHEQALKGLLVGRTVRCATLSPWGSGNRSVKNFCGENVKVSEVILRNDNKVMIRLDHAIENYLFYLKDVCLEPVQDNSGS